MASTEVSAKALEKLVIQAGHTKASMTGPSDDVLSGTDVPARSD
jgi:hypothetical protein